MKSNILPTAFRALTINPHLGGTPADEQTVAQYVYNAWKQQGLDYVTNMTYDVLLSFPDSQIPNQVYILDEKDNTVFSSSREEKMLVPEQNRPEIVQPFAAYSGSGTVLVNYHYFYFHWVLNFCVFRA